jgi:hypothetical protein
MIPLTYLPPNKPNILLQKPIKNLKMDDCWLMKVEIGKSVEVHHFDFYHFNQTELSDSTPMIIILEVSFCIYFISINVYAFRLSQITILF